MCRMCDTLSSDKDTVWYKDPRQYSNRLYKLREPGKRAQEVQASAGFQGRLQQAIDAKSQGDTGTHDTIISEMNKRALMHPGCQVLPLEEMMAIADMGTPMGAMKCICRETTRGCEECSLSEYTCMGLGTGMYKWERWPERYKGGVEFLSPNEAKEWMEHWDRKGMVHMVMQEGGDFLGGICNCDYPDCMPIRNRIDNGLTAGLVKGEFVCFIDFEKCNGCGDCLGRCNFNALKYETTTEKANIDQFACFGCGLCETACPRDAIFYRERSKLPGLANVW